MKYFTPELLERLQSSDEDESEKADEAWDLAIKRSNRRMAGIKKWLPKGVRKFEEDRICLHDAQLLRMARHDDVIEMVLETEPPSRDLVVLSFRLSGDPEIDRAALPGRCESGRADWLYEEWDVDRAGRCHFEVLLSNGWSVKLPVRDLNYQIARRLFPEDELKQTTTSPSTMAEPA